MVLSALAIVGSAGLVLFNHNRHTWTVHEAKVGDKAFPDFPVNSVAAIHVKGVVDFNIVRTNGFWRIPERSDYPANFAIISDLLLKIRDLKVFQSDLVGPSQLAGLDLGEPGSGKNSGTLFEFKDEHDKLLASLLAGKKHDKPQNESEPLGLHGMFNGRYILLPRDPHNLLLVSDELAAAQPEPGSWLNTDFFKIENIRFISLVSTNAANSWEISRESNSSPWVLANPNPGETLDTNVVNDPGEILAFPRFDDVIPKTPANLASHGLDKPIVVTVLTDGLAYTLKVGRKNPDGTYPMTVAVAGNVPTVRAAAPYETPEDKARLDAEFQARTQDIQKKLARGKALEPWIYQVDHWIELVIRDRSQLLEKQTAASTQTTPQSSP